MGERGKVTDGEGGGNDDDDGSEADVRGANCNQPPGGDS